MLIKLKKYCLLVLLIVICVSVPCAYAITNSVSHPESLTVVIDAGHGGIDNGASGTVTNISESELNLSVALKLKTYFENAGLNVVMTRSNSLGLYGIASKGFKLRDLKKRMEITENANADIFISIHMNKFPSKTAKGSRMFYNGFKQSILLAQKIKQELDKIDGATGDEIKLGDYYILNNSPIPSVLCECGFLSTPEEEAKLLTEEYQHKLAYSIFIGSCAYFYENPT